MSELALHSLFQISQFFKGIRQGIFILELRTFFVSVGESGRPVAISKLAANNMVLIHGQFKTLLPNRVQGLLLHCLIELVHQHVGGLSDYLR